MSLSKYIYFLFFIVSLLTTEKIVSQGSTTLTINAVLPNEPIGDYIARDKIIALPGSKFIANSGAISRLYLDKNVIAPITNSDYNQSNDFDVNSTYTIDKNLPVGFINGTYGVGNGQSLYNIPIPIAPGTAGMVPNISISYNSSSTEGIVGVGWNIDGISAIKRAQYDYYHLASVRPIALDATDYFTLDGNFIYGKAPTFNTDQAKRLENDNFTDVIQVGNYASFLVTTKDGLIMEYGNTTSSKLIVNNDAGVPIPLVYYINKVTDKNGNYYTYDYINQNGEIALKEIKYTGNSAAGIAPYNSVSFYYETRDDKNTKYFKGNILNTSLILREIEVFCEGQSIKRIVPKYNGGGDGKTYLTRITEYGLNDTKLNPTTFAYDLPSFVNLGVSDAIDATGLPALADYKVGDFNGDGKADILAYTYSSVDAASGQRLYNGWGLYINQNDGTSYSLVQSYNGVFTPYSYFGLPNTYSPDAEGVNSINLNGDDKEDAIFSVNSGINTIYTPQFSNGNGFTPGVSFSVPAGSSLLFADINGDKIMEAIAYNSILSDLYIYNFKTQIMQTVNTNVAIVGLNGSNVGGPIKILQVIDFDGDGVQELLVELNSKAQVLKVDQYNSNIAGVSFVLNVLATDFNLPLLAPYSTENLYGDFNGDGLTDNLTQGTEPTTFFPLTAYNNFFLRFNTSKSNNAILNATYYTSPSIPMATILAGRNNINCKVIIMDINNDGKSDIVSIKRDITSNSVYVETALGPDFLGTLNMGNLNNYNFPDVVNYNYFTNQAYPTDGNLIPEFTLGDFDGDNYIDIMFKNSNNGQRTIIYSHPIITEGKLAKVTNGFNQQIKFDYKTLAKGGIYTKGTGSSYPFVDVQYPVKVVSSVETQDALGNFYSTDYTYEGAKMHMQGKGFLGFDKISIVNNLQQTKTVSLFDLNTTYAQRTPINSKTYFLSDLTNPISETQSNFTYVPFTDYTGPFGSLRHYTKLNQSTTHDNVNGVHTVTDLTYDNYLNTTLAVTNINSGLQINQSTFTVDQSNLYGNRYPSFVTAVETSQTTQGKQPITDITSYLYTTNGLIQRITNNDTKPCSSYTEFTYETNTGSALTTKINGLNTKITTVEYDSKFRFITKVINPLGYFTTSVFDNRFGVPTKTTDITNLSTTYTYDDFGRSITIKTPDNNTSQSVIKWYDSNDDISGDPFLSSTSPLIVTKSILPNNPVVSSFVTATGLTVKTTSEGFNQNFIADLNTYNGKGQLVNSKASYLIPCANPSTVLNTTNTYNTLNRLVSTKLSNGTINPTSTITYNQTGGNTTVVVTSLSSKTKTTITDALGRITSVKDNLNAVLTYDYNSDGTLNQTKLGSNVVLTNTYDPCKNLQTQLEPNKGLTTLTFDNLGQLITRVNNGHQYDYHYDELGRVKDFMGSEGQYLYQYKTTGSGKGLIEQETAPSGTINKYYYDNLNRVTKKEVTISGQTFATQVAFDQYSNVIQYIYPSGFKVKSVYNALGYLSQIKDETNNKLLWQGDEINSFADYNKYTLGNNIQTTKTFDDFGMLTNEQAGSTFNYSYDFDVLSGNLKSWQDNLKGLKETFIYDGLDRLTTATVGNLSAPLLPPLTMGYDPNGNINIKSDVNDYRYDPSKFNQAVAVHDDISNLISHTTQDIAYTAFDQPDNIIEGTDVAVFTYGPDQNRVKVDYTNATGTSSRFYLDGYEKETVGAITREIHYIGAPSGLAAMYVIENGIPQTYFTYSDHLGTPKTITDVTGALVAEQNFDVWGQRRNPNTWDNSAVPNPPAWLYRGYTGHEHLPQFSLINMNGRLYDPQNARMLSADPILNDATESQAYNKYSYANNNPLSYTDPSGYDYVTWGGGGATNNVGSGANSVDLFSNLNGRGWSGLDMHQSAFESNASSSNIYSAANSTENYDKFWTTATGGLFGNYKNIKVPVYNETPRNLNGGHLSGYRTERVPIIGSGGVRLSTDSKSGNNIEGRSVTSKGVLSSWASMNANYAQGNGGDSPTKSSIGLDGWEHVAGPALYLLATPTPKRFIAQNSSQTSALLSETLSKVFPQKIKMGATRRLYTHTVNGSPRYAATWGRFFGRWGTRLAGPIGLGLTAYDLGSFLYEHDTQIQQGLEDRNRWIQEGIIPFK